VLLFNNERVVAEPARHHIVARTTVEPVMPSSPNRKSFPVLPTQRIVAGTAIDRVIACQGIDDVISRGAV